MSDTRLLSRPAWVFTLTLLSVVILAGVAACEGDSKEQACPSEVVLTDADIPCSCGDMVVDSLPGSTECVCLAEGLLDCGGEGDSSAW